MYIPKMGFMDGWNRVSGKEKKNDGVGKWYNGRWRERQDKNEVEMRWNWEWICDHNNVKIRMVKLGPFVKGFNGEWVGALCF